MLTSYKTILTITIVVSLGFTFSDSYAEEFLSPIPDDSTSFSDPNTALVAVNPNLLSQDSMTISIFEKSTLITHERTITRADNDFTYIGSTPSSFENVYIAYLDGKMRLELDSIEYDLILEPYGDYHSITSNIQEFGPEQEGIIPVDSSPYEHSITEFPSSLEFGTIYTLDVINFYTNESVAVKGVTGITLMANLGIDRTNTALFYSDIPVVLNNVGVFNVGINHTESGNAFTERNRINNANDEFMPDAITLREQTGADVGVLFLSATDPPLCGVAPTLRQNPEKPFVVVIVKCTNHMGQLIAHELGHLGGGYHNLEALGRYYDDPWPYHHGNIDLDAKKSTLMAYNCKRCEHQSLWSDPTNVFYNTNTTSGTILREDNARVFANTFPIMSTYRDVPLDIPTQILNLQNEIRNIRIQLTDDKTNAKNQLVILTAQKIDLIEQYSSIVTVIKNDMSELKILKDNTTDRTEKHAIQVKIIVLKKQIKELDIQLNLDKMPIIGEIRVIKTDLKQTTIDANSEIKIIKQKIKDLKSQAKQLKNTP